MTDGYVLKSSVFNALHNGDIEIYVDSYQGWHYLRLLSKKIDKKIKGLPATDVAPVRHGQWILIEYPYGQKTYICSECKDDDWWNGRYAYGDEHYCPNCGAKMDGKGTDNE